MHEQLRTALTAATARGVTVAVLAEDPLDDPNFSGAPAKALSGLLVNRLRWPIDQRRLHRLVEVGLARFGVRG
jgi:hypothetical protein